MRPIVLDAEREDEKKRNKQVDLEAHRAQQRAKQEEAAAMKARQTEPKAPLQPHEPGFRYHASIPQPAKLDYVVNPGRKSMGGEEEGSQPTGGNSGRGGKPGGLLDKKYRELERKRKGNFARASKVSVEGRSINIVGQ
eukprot:jgi/Chrzof1/11637/Cz06g03070.t1